MFEPWEEPYDPEKHLNLLLAWLDQRNKTISDASAALDAAGIPHVDGVSIAERVRALAAELERPMAGPWVWNWGANTDSRYGLDGRKLVTVYEGGEHWCDYAGDKQIHEGGKDAADAFLLSAGYRLVGGVHPLSLEVRP